LFKSKRNDEQLLEELKAMIEELGDKLKGNKEKALVDYCIHGPRWKDAECFFAWTIRDESTRFILSRKAFLPTIK